MFNEVQSYISIKLIKKEESKIDKEYSPEDLINNIYNKYYALINIGNPSQLTEAQLNCNIEDLFFSERICQTEYYFDKSKSISLSQVFIKNPKYPFTYNIYASDNMTFIQYDLNSKLPNKVEINNYTFLYETENPSDKNLNKEKQGRACMSFGLKIMCPSNSFYCRTFLDILKDNQLINSKNFFINYYKEKTDNYDAEIIIGNYPHEFDKDKYSINKYYKSRAEISLITSMPDWVFNFQNYLYTSNGTRINFYLTRIKEYMQGNFTFDLDNIIGINEYLYQIKINYFNKHLNECQINNIQNRYTVITCDKNFIGDDFPTLYFENIEANYTLELTYKDLFQIRGNKKYFLIIFDRYNIVPWIFGKIFMQKYLFNFEADNKMIGYYIPQEKSKNDKKSNSNEENKDYAWILWVIIIIFIGIICLLLGSFLCKKKRRKRANEMEDDDYDYIQESKKEKLNSEEGDDKLMIN